MTLLCFAAHTLSHLYFLHHLIVTARMQCFFWSSGLSTFKFFLSAFLRYDIVAFNERYTYNFVLLSNHINFVFQIQYRFFFQFYDFSGQQF